MREHGPTCECNDCWPFGDEQPLSFGTLAARQAARERYKTPLPSPMQPESGKRSLLGVLGDALFGDIKIRSLRPGMLTDERHTLCDEHVDFLNLTLARERVELLQERRQWLFQRNKEPHIGANRITEIDSEIAMIDSITLILRRQP
jgi:hypothetical protein